MSLNLDRSTWKHVRLGDVISRSRKQVEPGDGSVDRYVAGGHVDTESVIIRRSGDVADGQMGSTFHYLFKPGQVIFVSARPYLRKIGVPDFAGVVADKTYVLEAAPGSGLIHELLPFLLTSERFIEYATQEATGSMNPRLLWGPMQRYEFHVPPLDDQKRIADLLWAVERHLVELEDRFSATTEAFQRFLGDAFSAASGPSVAIVDLCTDVVGGIWGVPEGEDEVDVLALGPRIYAPGTTGFVTHGSPVRSVSKRQAESRLVRADDIILERSGGSPTQPVGRVVIAGPGLSPCIPTDFQRLLRPNRSLVEPRYLFWQLRHDWAAGLTRDYSKKTTNITNLSVRDYLAREIRVPSYAHQILLLSYASTFEVALTSMSTEISALGAMRSSLLAEIFGRR